MQKPHHRPAQHVTLSLSTPTFAELLKQALCYCAADTSCMNLPINFGACQYRQYGLSERPHSKIIEIFATEHYLFALQASWSKCRNAVLCLCECSMTAAVKCGALAMHAGSAGH